VQQTIRPSRRPLAGARAQGHRRPNDRSLTITEALNRNGHLMITGEPGAGKSTVGYMYVQHISDVWLNESDGAPPLTEPVLPLRIPATALAENKAWADLLVRRR